MPAVQYERQSKLSCLTETTRWWLFCSQLTKIKTVHKLLWPLLVVNLRIPGLICRGTVYFVQITQLLSYLATLDELRAGCHAKRRRPIFGAKLAWRHKMFHPFHFLQSRKVFEIVNPLSCIFNAISSEESCLISVSFLTC